MRKAILLILPVLALALSGCKTNDAIPPADGIYAGGSGTINPQGGLVTPSGTDTIFALIDANNNGVIVDQTTAAIYHFTVPTPDNNGNFSTNFTYCPGATFGVSSSTCSTSGNTLTGTLSGTSSTFGTSSLQNTITGTISVAGGAQEAFTLSFNSTAYESNVVQLSTLVTPVGTTSPYLQFSYTPSGGSTAVLVTFNLLDTLETNTTTGLTYYDFSGNDNQVPSCTYTGGQISMPSGSYNAYELSVTRTCGSTVTKQTGLAYINGNSPSTLTLEYNDNSDFAVATSSAALYN